MPVSYDELPFELTQKLQKLEVELKDGDITEKGYNKKKNQLLQIYEQNSIPESQPIPAMEINLPSQKPDTIEPSAADVKDFLDFLPSPTHSPTMNTGAEYMARFHHQERDKTEMKDAIHRRVYSSKRNPSFSMLHARSSSLDSKPDVHHHHPSDSENDWKFDSSTRSIQSTPSSSRSSGSNSVRRAKTVMMGRSRYRESYMASSFKAIEPAPQPYFTDISDLAGRQMTPIEMPITNNTPFKTLIEALKSRSNSTEDAFLLLDHHREIGSLSFEKLNSKAEKIAFELRKKKKEGGVVALIYRKSEILEFIPALFGCFLAGVVAVPINTAEDKSELSFILSLTNIDLILSTNENQRAFVKEMKETLEWWKTDEMNDLNKTSSEIVLPELAYIEYAKASNGELKGVMVSHVSIIEQCVAFQQMIKHQDECILTHYEPRQQIGLFLSVLYPVFAGNTVIFTNGNVIDTPPLWIHLISKYKVTMALTDYPSMKSVTRFFQENTKDVLSYSKKVTPDLSSLRNLMIDTHTVESSLNDYIAESLLRPLGNCDDPLNVVNPVLSVPEYGGKIISMKDRIQCLFETRALKSNKVLVLAVGNEAIKAESQGTLVEAFGYCMPKAKVAIVDPDTTTLCPPDTLGEVWIDLPSTASDGFWALPQHTELIFHAKPILVTPDSLEYYNGSFLRTGLCGTLIGGRLFVMGSYEDRIRQRQDSEQEDIFFSNVILNTISKRAQIDECAVIEILVKDQHLPVILCESPINDMTELSIKATQVDDALVELHDLRAFCIVFVKPNALPRVLVHGRRRIHPLLTKRHFLQGRTHATFIKMDVDRTIFNLAVNEDPICKNLWRSTFSYERARALNVIPNHKQLRQHTGMEVVNAVLDERIDMDMSRFTNALDILQWRASMYPEETAFIAYNEKTFSWKKTSYKIASIASHIVKKGVKRGNKVLVSIPFSMDYLFAIYACLVIGAVPVPVEPPDLRRVSELVQLLIDASRDLSASYIITNSAAEDIFKSSNVKSAFKSQLKKNEKLPEMINITKASRNKKMLGKESGFIMREEWTGHNIPALILIHHSPEGRRYYVYMGHDTLMNQCRTQKATCQMRCQRSIVASALGAYEGLGFLYSLFCGVYVGCTTVYLPAQEFYMNPALLFECFQKYKVKDAFVTNMLMQYAMNRMHTKDTHFILLNGLQNIMLATDGRPKPLFYHHIAKYFSRYRLEKESINTIYANVGNPMVTTRSYMLIEPITLSLDPYWLKYGIISILPHEEEAYGVLLHDSGIVPSNTSIAIVNPETHELCPSYMMGEIWVRSDNNVQMLYSKDDPSSNQRFNAAIKGVDPTIKYMRTGDYGFLWSIQRRMQNQPVMEQGQCLYVLGSINETLSKDGLVYFPFDIEISIERCHPTIPSGGSVVFQTSEEVVAVIAVKVIDYAISIVPLAVSAILERHHFLIDTVVIVHPNTLTRSRFGEKMRRSIMQAYTESKLTSIYVQRITNQHEDMSLPQWRQSQSSDNSSVIDTPDKEKRFSFQFSRTNSQRSRFSIPPSPSLKQTEPISY